MATGVYGPRFYGADLDVGVTTQVTDENSFKQSNGDVGWFDALGNPIPSDTVTAAQVAFAPAFCQ